MARPSNEPPGLRVAGVGRTMNKDGSRPDAGAYQPPAGTDRLRAHSGRATDGSRLAHATLALVTAPTTIFGSAALSPPRATPRRRLPDVVIGGARARRVPEADFRPRFVTDDVLVHQSKLASRGRAMRCLDGRRLNAAQRRRLRSTSCSPERVAEPGDPCGLRVLNPIPLKGGRCRPTSHPSCLTHFVVDVHGRCHCRAWPGAATVPL